MITGNGGVSKPGRRVYVGIKNIRAYETASNGDLSDLERHQDRPSVAESGAWREKCCARLVRGKTRRCHA